MATEFNPGRQIRVEKANGPTNASAARSGNWRTIAVTAVILGLVAGSLYFSTTGRNAPTSNGSPGISTAQSPTPSPSTSPNAQSERRDR